MRDKNEESVGIKFVVWLGNGMAVGFYWLLIAVAPTGIGAVVGGLGRSSS